ncbi:MAG: hypothetical protein VW270_11000 [Candidatus Poseidoniales archaeon]
MMHIHFHQLSQHDMRFDLSQHRWLIIQGSEMNDAQTALMLSELEDILVAVDLRGHQFTPGLWERATHLCILDSKENLEEIQSKSSISQLLQGDEIDIIEKLW